MSERDQLIGEMQQAGERSPAEDRVDILQQLMEADPPRRHSYEALTFIGGALLVSGVLLMISGAVGASIAITGPGASYSLESGGPQIPAALGLRWAGAIISGSALLAGFMMIVSSQWLKLFIDLQENSDRQSFALHAIFQLALADRHKEADRGQVP